MDSPRPHGTGAEPLDVLVVGAGPTGLALAAALSAFDVSLRVVDAATSEARESRALAMQPRTLEVLRPFGVVGDLLARGNPATRLVISVRGRVARTPLFDLGAEDTEFPFLLFVSQAETEAVLLGHLTARAVEVERGVTFESSEKDHDDGLVCALRRADGTREIVRARYVVGCDGARSTVRDLAGIPFVGGRYPQTFLLADLSARGLEPGTVNAYIGPDGPLFFFPLGHPAPWRLITTRPMATSGTGPDRVTVGELQRVSDQATRGAVRVHDPVWTSVFRVHHRAATRYRVGRVFVAGDAAHVHSPAGAQGMNTGIQDAVNLGWKLGLVCRGAAPDLLLDTYDAERRPVGEFVLRFSDRAFTVATSANPLIRAARSHVVPRALPLALRYRAGRRLAFRTVSQLGIRYRTSPAVTPAPRGRRGPRPGDRLPDARVHRGGSDVGLQEALGAPTFHLLLCGPAEVWDGAVVEDLRCRHAPFVTVHRLTPADRPSTTGPDLVDLVGTAFSRLQVRGHAHLVVRPDGHLGYRGDHADLAGADRYLATWLTDVRGADGAAPAR